MTTRQDIVSLRNHDEVTRVVHGQALPSGFCLDGDQIAGNLDLPFMQAQMIGIGASELTGNTVHGLGTDNPHEFDRRLRGSGEPIRVELFFDDIEHRGRVKVSHPIVAETPDFDIEEAKRLREEHRSGDSWVDSLGRQRRYSGRGGLTLLSKGGTIFEAGKILGVLFGEIKTEDSNGKRIVEIGFTVGN